MAENNHPVFELTTSIPETKTVKIDGDHYELIPSQRLGLGDVLYIQHASNYTSKLFGKSEMFTDEEYDQATRVIVRAVSKILHAPEEVIARLSVTQQIQIVDVWNRELGERDPLSGASENPSPDSSGSTEEIRGNG
ncbi:hypothetical protein MYX75_01050 [Acidobacteria bacterium AH-259-A15]|nr:hypothetical protein [Acidobacteria bacterium AH-259-A15]